MIDFIEYLRKGSFDVGEIHQPAGIRLWLAGDVDFHAERMPVQPRAFVAGGTFGRRCAASIWNTLKMSIYSRTTGRCDPVVAMGGLEPPTPAL